MFGLLDLSSCDLARDRRSFYACNVCNALASKFGRRSRVMLTNDSVYLSLLIAAQRDQMSYENPTPPERCRPWSRDAFCTPEFKYPAAVSVLAAGISLIDNVHDIPSAQSKVHYAFWRSRIREAEQELRELGLSLPPIETLVREQHKRETVTNRELTYYSAATEETYSKIFSQTATLAGAPPNANYLAEVGRHVGRIAYLLDAYADFQKDRSKGSFNVFDQLPPTAPKSRLLASPRQLFTAHAAHSLQCIEENILKVRLHRFETTIRYIVTDGLRVKMRRIIEGTGNPMSTSALYSLTPLIATLTLVGLRSLITPLQGGDNSDCCDCSSLIPSPEECIWAAFHQEALSVAGSVQQGVGAAVVGGGAAVAVSAIASHLSASSQQPSTEESPSDTSSSSTTAQEPIGPPEQLSAPPEQPPETLEETPQVPTIRNPFGTSTLTDDEVRQTIQWGVQHDRSPEDIQDDLNELDKARGGSGNVDLSNLPDDQRPARVTTRSGEITMTQKDAVEYNAQRLVLDDVNQRANQIHNQLQNLQGDSAFWRQQELNVGRRTVAGGYKLHEANQAYQDAVNQINQKYQKPDLKDYRDSLDWQRAVEDWRKTPEGQGTGLSEEHARELAQAQSAHVNKLEELTGRKDIFNQPVPEPAPAERFLQYGDSQPTYASKPTSGESWWHKPAVKLDAIEQQQQKLIDELKRLEEVKRTAVNKMKSIEQHGAQDSADGG
jgi:hypothetical protein